MNRKPRRCRFCGRLCRYFGCDRNDWCRICQMWVLRNQACQQRNKIAKDLPIVLHPNFLTWRIILDMLCGSYVDEELRAARDIWAKVLLGKCLHLISISNFSLDDLEGFFPTASYKKWLWKLLRKHLMSSYSLRRLNGDYTEDRILSVIIDYLGGFNPWQCRV